MPQPTLHRSHSSPRLSPCLHRTPLVPVTYAICLDELESAAASLTRAIGCHQRADYTRYANHEVDLNASGGMYASLPHTVHRCCPIHHHSAPLLPPTCMPHALCTSCPCVSNALDAHRRMPDSLQTPTHSSDRHSSARLAANAPHAVLPPSSPPCRHIAAAMLVQVCG